MKKTVTEQLYGRYLYSSLVQQTEDALSQRDIGTIVKELGITKEKWNGDENIPVRRHFWGIVRERHDDAL